jgi:outer membrane lipoprotein carrier protein
MPRVFLFLLLGLSLGLARADGLQSLSQFIAEVKTGRAEFTQVVSPPLKNGVAQRSKTSSGTFEFARPQRFKFVYKKPFEQSIVADGQTLWLLDVDLNQVTARKQAQALSATPVALLAAAPDARALQADFLLSNMSDQDGLQWVLATPRAPDNQLQAIRVGFRPTKGALATLEVLEILDSFGQHSRITFANWVLNLPLSASTFVLQVPAGADVIRQ